jgi:hypothetical protein
MLALFPEVMLIVKLSSQKDRNNGNVIPRTEYRAFTQLLRTQKGFFRLKIEIA